MCKNAVGESRCEKIMIDGKAHRERQGGEEVKKMDRKGRKDANQWRTWQNENDFILPDYLSEVYDVTKAFMFSTLRVKPAASSLPDQSLSTLTNPFLARSANRLKLRDSLDDMIAFLKVEKVSARAGALLKFEHSKKTNPTGMSGPG